jgi:hypothetical protein
MKKFKNLLVLLAAGVFVAVCVFNVMLGSADYDKVSSSLFTLEALSNGEGGGGESNAGGKCKSKAGALEIVTYYYENPPNPNPHPRIKKIIYTCDGSDGGECKPGNSYLHYDYDGNLTHTDDSARSVAFCSVN